MNKVELLSPAKNKETAIEAINCGADAVYIGAPSFGARKKASNTLDDIEDVVNYAHKFWARVHVTLNTILTDSELEEAVEIFKELDKIGVDAVIVQDMGLINRLKDLSLSLPIHASTQCDNYLPEKINFFKEIGLSRVVLARDLSIEQINQIHKENPNLELESFIHGALCVSMSGQCYLSQYIGGRSANRGECAQPCRKQYTVMTKAGKIIKENFYPLCLKDFNGSKYIDELIDAGVKSFKIEGRLKDVGYVKNVTAYYAKLLEGRKSSSGRSVYPFIPNPDKSFNRGFTDYFLEKRKDCFNFESPKSRGEYLGEVVEVKKDFIVVKTEKEIHPQDGIYFNDDGFLVNKSVNNTINSKMLKQVQHDVEKLAIYPNKQLNIKIGDKLYRNYDSEFEKELLKPVKRQIGVVVNVITTLSDECCEAAGGGYLSITLTDEDGVAVTAKITQSEQAKNPEKMKETFIKQFCKTGESDFYIENIEINSELPFMPVSEINNLRRILFKDLMDKRIEVYNTKIKQVQKPLNYAQFYLDEIDYRGNVHNKSAKEFYEKCGSKVVEPSLETNVPRHQVELMRCKHCIKYALNMCKSPQELVLKDSHGEIYPLKFNCKTCEMSVID